MAETSKATEQRQPITEFCRAVSFFTRLPLGGGTGPLAAASWAFPLVGAGIGAAGAGVLFMLHYVGLPPLAAAFVAVAAVAIWTGGLHEDGMADSADGWGGGRSFEHRLEIMRDSRIGTYGVLALIFVVGLRVSLLAALVTTPYIFVAVIVAASGSRAVLPYQMRSLPLAATNGLAVGAGIPTRLNALMAVIIAVALVSVAFTPLQSVILILCATVTVIAMSALARRQIGGYNGDTLGATQQITEISILSGVTVMSGLGIS